MRTRIPVTVFEKLVGPAVHVDTNGKRLFDLFDENGNSRTYVKVWVGDEEKIGRVEDGYLIYTIGT